MAERLCMIEATDQKELKVKDISKELFKKGIVSSENCLALVIDNFLSKTQCEDLIQKTEAKGYEQALLNIGGGAQMLNTRVRNSDRCIVDDTELAATFYERSKQFIPESFAEGWTKCGINERLRFLRYDKGCYFKPHFDGCYERPDGQEKSFVTFFLFLNEGYKGGCSTFISPASKQVVYPCKPKVGRLVIFQHRIYHEGSMLEKGRKYALRSDYMYRKTET